MPARPIAALVPIYQRFSNAVRATALREIAAAAACAPADTSCQQKRSIASRFLARGDAAAGAQAKVFYWSRAIAIW
jgi:hypothetical protein